MDGTRRKNLEVVVSIIAVALLLVAMGCVAQVRDVRKQTPFLDAPEGTKIALIDIDVPEWVVESAPEGDDPATLIRSALEVAFTDSPYRLVDRLEAGGEIAIGPDTKPSILKNASRVAIVGRPFIYDAGEAVRAYGAPGMTWELVSGPEGFRLNPETGEIRWIPQSTGRVAVTLLAKNHHGEDRYNFAVEVEDDEEEIEILLRPLPAPVVSQDQLFVGAPAAELPASITEPLVLAAHVIGWNEMEESAGGDRTRRRVTADVVYSLWTRHGREIETRRVRVSAVRLQSFQTVPDMVPQWSAWKRINWESDSGYRPKTAPMDESELFRAAADVSARAFAYPYGNREVHFSAQLADDAALKPGLELVKASNWEGAYQSFAEAAEANPELAGAYYNMGVMRELQGRTEEAIEYYRRAVGLDGRGMHSRQLSAAERRFELHQDLTEELEAEAKAEAKAELEAEKEVSEESAAVVDEEDPGDE